MADSTHYVIRGGIEGRERLRMLSRVMHSFSAALLDRLDIREGQSCLDVGCGGGDVTLELARRVGPQGRVVGTDIDQVKLDLARQEAAEQGVSHVEFRFADIRTEEVQQEFDVVYARFLLTHLSDPEAAVNALYQRLRPGGFLAVEDIDCTGHFHYPESKAFDRYIELYTSVVKRRGGDANIGPRLPGILMKSGFEVIGVAVVQPVGMEGEVKLLNPLTMESIAGAVLAEGLATREEIEEVTRELYEFAADPQTLTGAPRIVQAWGRRPEDRV